MINRIIFLLAFCFSFTQSFADIPLEFPLKETVVLKLPNGKPSDWKEISRFLGKKEGVVERIPKNQTIDKWNQVIVFQYNTDAKRSTIGVRAISDGLKTATKKAYPGSQVTWKLIELNKFDFIYEWVLHTPYKDIPVQHEVARGFLTEKGFHRVAFNRRYQQMDENEKNKWLKVLKESVSVESIEKANELSGLSLIERLQNSVVLGNSFSGWSLHDKYESAKGITLAIWIPESQKGSSFVTECLEVQTCPMMKSAGITSLFDLEKERIQKIAGKDVQISILKQTPNEIVYTYTHPADKLQLTSVVRTFISECGTGYCSIVYKQGLPERSLTHDEIEKCQNDLESIKIGD